MAHRRSSRSVDRAFKLARLLHHDSSVLLELYKNKEGFTDDMTAADGHLVSVPRNSSQLEATDRLWRLHSALLQCRGLLDIAIAKEEEELGGGEKGEYETQRKTVKDRLSYLLNNTGELLKDAGGLAVSASDSKAEAKSLSHLFELKRWIYQIYQEVEYWAKVASTALAELSVGKARGKRRPGAAPGGQGKGEARR